MNRTLLLVGGGQTSAVAARTLRRRGYDGHIVLIGDEPHRPYQRPPLSKEYLAAGDGSALDLLPESWTEANDVDVRTGTKAVKISAADGSVLLDDGTTLSADAVLVATGSRARSLPGVEGDGVFRLRVREDADALREAIGPDTRVLLVGGGFIGGEVASCAHARGATVTVLEAAAQPLAHAVGTDLGAAYAAMMRGAGVDLRCGVTVSGVRREGAETVVSTSDGDLAADVVVVGIGAEPNVDLAVDSGLTVDGGIVVDEHCRTSQDHVFAAGDVTRHFHPGIGAHVRVEHFDNASRQGAVAARSMLGEEAVHDEPHWFWSDQFDRNLQYVGHANGSDRIVVRGSLDDPSWTAFFHDGDKVTAAFALDGGEDITVARELVRFGAPVAVAQLADPGVDLFELMEDL